MPSPADLAGLTLADLMRGAAGGAGYPEPGVGPNGELVMDVWPRRSTPDPQLSRARVGAGEHELPYMPPLSKMLRHQGEMRSGNEFPLSDTIAETVGSPLAGVIVDKVAKMGRATGDAVAGMSGANLLPWAVGKADRLSDSLADMMRDGVITTAQAEDAPKTKAADPFAELAPLKQQQKELQDQLEEAKRNKAASMPKSGQLPDPRKRDANPRYWLADDQIKNLTTEIGKVTDKITTQTPLLEERARRLANEARDEQRREDAKLGGERLAEAKRNRSPWEKVVQDDAGALGAVTGMGLGHLARQGLPWIGQALPQYFGGGFRRMKALQEAENLRADTLLTAANKDWAKRAGDINTVAREGGPKNLRGKTPFAQSETKAGLEYNPKAPSGADLYDRGTKGMNFVKDATAGGALGGGESAIMHYTLVADAQKQRDEAKAAFDKNPTQENVKALMDATHNYEFWRAVEVGGRGFTGGYATAAALHPTPQVRPANIGNYDAETKRIRDWIDTTNRRPGAKRSPAQTPLPGSSPAGAGGALPGPAPAPTAAPQAAPTPIQSPIPQVAPRQSYPEPPNLPKGTTWNETAGRAQYPKGHPRAGEFVRVPKQRNGSNKAGNSEQSANSKPDMPIIEDTGSAVPYRNGKSSGLSALLRSFG